MKKPLFFLMLLLSFNSFAFVHTYIFVQPDYGMGGQIEFYECEENPYTYTITYDGSVVDFNDFPFMGQFGTKTLNFTATETSTSNTYTFSADIDFNGNNPSITYNTSPTTLPLSVIETFMPPTGSCDGEIELLINGGYTPVSVNWIQPSNLTGNNPTGLCAGQYQYSVGDTYNFCGMGSPLVRTIQLDNFMCEILVTEPSCPEVCDAQAELLPMVGNNTIIMQDLVENNNSTSHPSLLTGLCGGNSLMGTLFHLSGQQAFCSQNVVDPDGLEFTMDTVDVSVQGANDGSATVNITSGAAPHTYDWSGPNSYSENGSNNVTGLEPGLYTVVIGFNNGCDSTVTFTILDGGAPSMVQEDVNNIKIYPQPVSQELVIVTTSGLSEVFVMNSLGAVVYQESLINDNKIIIDLGHVEAGIYFVKMKDINSKISTHKIIKQ